MRLYLISPQSNSHTEYSRLACSTDGLSVTRVASSAIATVAAFAPVDVEISLCDEAVQSIRFDDSADAVGISANVSQGLRAIEIAGRFRKRGMTVIMGGPHVSLAPELFADHADTLVVGEFEPIAEEFFTDLRSGKLKRRYDGSPADLTRSPPPRWDLYPNSQAISGVVQTSRGCPFECNFCDVIQYLGRIQRHKTDDQVIHEIQALYDLGYNFISLADDNFTVYRKRARSLLGAIRAWNGGEGRDYVTFATQMSIDVARDPELLGLCADAGLLNAFIGIETSDPAALIESKKRQNVNVDLVAACETVVRAGLRIEGGLMLGFDTDDQSVFARQYEFAMALPVGTFNVSVLVAPQATPLYYSMKAQNRIVSDDVLAQFPSANLLTNIRPAQMTADDLYVGTKWLINKLFDPDNFYTRLLAMSRLLAPPPWRKREAGARYQHPNRRPSEALFASVMRSMVRADGRIAKLVRDTFALMKARPQLRDSLADALTHYLMTLRAYQLNGVCVDGWADMQGPPFGHETAESSLRAIRSKPSHANEEDFKIATGDQEAAV